MISIGTESERQVAIIQETLEQGAVVVLSGAGLSTSSGIPDYRDRQGQWKRARPVDHSEFVRSDTVRKRYWARSYVGWPTVDGARPTPGHLALAQLERQRRIALIVTQNVDGLHQKADSREVLELHGRLDRVVCLSCHAIHRRTSVQEWLRDANPGFAASAGAVAPDGDAQIGEDLHSAFRVPDCPSCGGVLKPDVVFFGDSVPTDRVDACFSALQAARGLLIVGSSLMAYSGYRLAIFAHQRGTPVMAINLGTTRADHLLCAKVQLECDDFLQRLCGRLEVRSS